MVYGGGDLPWEWSNEYRLRPVVYPLIFAVVFKILNCLYLDFRFLILYSPHLIHVIFWQISDYLMYKLFLNESYSPNNNASLAMIMYMGVWTILVMNARTSTNAIETILLPIGVYYWTQIKDSKTNGGEDIRFKK